MTRLELEAALHPLHQPTAIAWFPAAPGYLILFALILFLLLAFSFYRYQYQKKNQAKNQALALLKNYQAAYQKTGDSQHSSIQISALLRRVALIYHGRQAVAGLEGEAWIQFLCQYSKNLDFQGIKTYLLDLPFQPKRAEPLDALFKIAAAWIQQRGRYV